MKRILLTMIIIGLFDILKGQPNNSDTTIYQNVEIMPEFIEGDLGFRKYIVANFNAPDNNCFVTFIRFTFVVEIDGTISNKEVIINDKHILLRTGNEDIEICKQKWIAAGITLLNNMPNWISGKKNNKNVRVKLTTTLNLAPQKDFWNN